MSDQGLANGSSWTFRDHVRDIFQRFYVPYGTGLGAIFLASAGWVPTLGWPAKVTAIFLMLGIAFTGTAIGFDAKHNKPEMLRLSEENQQLKLDCAGSAKQLIEKGQEYASLTDSLRDELSHRSVDLVGVVNILLRAVATENCLYDDETRISAYRHDGSSFFLMGRVSKSVQLAKVGRPSYPDSQGFIAQVWSGQAKKSKVMLPTSPEDWIGTQVDAYGFSESEAKSLRMQSRVMFAIRIQHDQNKVPYGVLCIESMRKAAISGGFGSTIENATSFNSLTQVLAITIKDLTGPDARRGLLNTNLGDPCDD